MDIDPGMPYRSELKRPDLKGTFPCSVCGKVFCHSSSLSRHRMQAHFKSYICTQCNQEISSCSGNETLRSHMFRIHSISRMFMCRCCNWAYPDKTSLHIHMQSMLRNGTPGDVSVLARSSNDGPGMAGAVGEMSPNELKTSPSGSPIDERNSESPPSTKQSYIKNTLFTNGALNGSIFPATFNNVENLLTRFSTKPDVLLHQYGSESHGQGNWLSAFFGNSGLISPYALVGNTSGNTSSDSKGESSISADQSDDSDKDVKQIGEAFSASDKSDNADHKIQNFSKQASTSQDTKASVVNGSSLDHLLEKKSVAGSYRNKRKASKPQQLRSLIVADDDEEDDTVIDRKKILVEKKPELCIPVTNGDANETNAVNHGVNGTTSVPFADVSTSSANCNDCTVLRAKCGMVETRNRFLESKILSHETKIDRLDVQLTGLDSTLRQYEHEQDDLRHHIDTFEEILLSCQQNAVTALALLQTGGPEALPTVKRLMESLLESTKISRCNGHCS